MSTAEDTELERLGRAFGSDALGCPSSAALECPSSQARDCPSSGWLSFVWFLTARGPRIVLLLGWSGDVRKGWIMRVRTLASSAVCFRSPATTTLQLVGGSGDTPAERSRLMRWDILFEIGYCDFYTRALDQLFS